MVVYPTVGTTVVKRHPFMSGPGRFPVPTLQDSGPLETTYLPGQGSECGTRDPSGGTWTDGLRGPVGDGRRRNSDLGWGWSVWPVPRVGKYDDTDDYEPSRRSNRV